MKTGSAKAGSVLQGYFRTDRLRGAANRAAVAQSKSPARSTPQAPRPELLPAGMRGVAAQPQAEPGPGRSWRGAPRPDLLPGMGPTRAGERLRAAQAWPSRQVSTTPVPAGQLRVIGHGRPLDDATRRTMESFFRADFSGVRVYEGPAAQAMGALAFTLGEDIHFAPGLYDPASRDGVELLGHELTHVVQQRDGRVVNPYGQGVAIVQDLELEAEADRMGQRIASELWAVSPPHPATLAQPKATGGVLARSQAVVAQRRGVLQAMNPLNVGARFETSKGSEYTVYRGDGIDRAKYYEPGQVTENPEKNIFYGDEKTTEACLEYRDRCASYKLFPASFGTWTIVFYDHWHRVIYSGSLQSWPQSGLYPVDMILKQNNEGRMPDDRFHVGDRIVKL